MEGLAARPRVLCVDDEPHVVGGLALHLRRRYQVEVATSGAAALELLARSPDTAVVISDMRMPQMSGAELLAQVCAQYPRTTRILLTGFAELDAAVRAINEGHVYRFLVKPCPPPELLRTVEAAAELHRLVTAEKVLLEETLQRSVTLLTDMLAITSPVAFGRASRIKHLVTRLADRLGLTERWQLEVAAMLSQLWSITLPAEVAEKLYYGSPLTPQEQQLVERAPDTTERLLANIPRLEVVREILLGCRPEHATRLSLVDSRDAGLADLGASLLRLATSFDSLEARGLSTGDALASLRSESGSYDPRALSALQEVCATMPRGDSVREVSLAALKAGMVLARDLRLVNGTLLIARGYEITEGFLARLANLRPGSVKEPVQITIRHDS